MVVRLSRQCFLAGCVGREDLVMTLLGVGNDGGWLLCWRRARLLCFKLLVFGVLIPGLPCRYCLMLGLSGVPVHGRLQLG